MNNWFLRTTDGFQTWTTREVVAADSVSPSAGTLRLIGQAPLLGSSEATIEGGGTISYFVDSFAPLFWATGGGVTNDLTLIWQGLRAVSPTRGTVRLIGQAPTLAQSRSAAPTTGTVRFVGQVPTLNATRQVSPSVGTVRTVGQQPTVAQTWSVAPTRGTIRLLGQTPTTDLGHKITSPVTGTVRIVGQGVVWTQLALTWTVFETAVSNGLSFFWQRSAGVSGRLGLTWNIHTTVCAIRPRMSQRRMTTATRQRSMTTRASQRQIRVKACANQ